MLFSFAAPDWLGMRIPVGTGASDKLSADLTSKNYCVCSLGMLAKKPVEAVLKIGNMFSEVSGSTARDEKQPG